VGCLEILEGGTLAAIVYRDKQKHLKELLLFGCCQTQTSKKIGKILRCA